MLKTTDGGATWVDQFDGVVGFFLDAAFANSSVGWAVGDGGTILHTPDGGTSWTQEVSGTSQLLHAIDFATAATGFASGSLGTLLRFVADCAGSADS